MFLLPVLLMVLVCLNWSTGGCFGTVANTILRLDVVFELCTQIWVNFLAIRYHNFSRFVITKWCRIVSWSLIEHAAILKEGERRKLYLSRVRSNVKLSPFERYRKMSKRHFTQFSCTKNSYDNILAYNTGRTIKCFSKCPNKIAQFYSTGCGDTSASFESDGSFRFCVWGGGEQTEKIQHKRPEVKMEMLNPGFGNARCPSL